MKTFRTFQGPKLGFLHLAHSGPEEKPEGRGERKDEKKRWKIRGGLVSLGLVISLYCCMQIMWVVICEQSSTAKNSNLRKNQMSDSSLWVYCFHM